MRIPAVFPKTLALAAALASLPISAVAFTAQNGMHVQQTGPGDMAVGYWSLASETDYWCAAGDYAARVLGVPSATRLYRATPKPRGRAQGIVFTLEPARRAEGAGLSSFGSGPRDGSISVGMAVGSYCRIPKPLDWF